MDNREKKSGRKCLVLGGAGFIGSYIAEELLGAGFKVTIFDKVKNAKNIEHVINKVRFVAGDMLKSSDIAAVLPGHDSVIHLACSSLPESSMVDPFYEIKTDIIPSMQFIVLAQKYGIKKIVFSSSGGTVYGIAGQTPISETHPTNPLNMYGVSKLTIENILQVYNRNYKMNNISLRTSNAYGEKQRTAGDFGAVAVFLGEIVRGEKITIWGDGSTIRDFIHIKDVAKAFLKALLLDENVMTSTFNIGSGIGTSLNELIVMLEDITGLSANIVYKQARPFDVPVNVLDVSLARDVLSFRASISLYDGLKSFFDYIKRYGSE